ncbi:class I SAM-dependent methyltransferase [Flexibacterium corallicola]|uniref:class I SAM-dependent methyltransferase n=1 Tax=Flexibacterium corallicola TaxID=3037259 RepID=UPI00286FA953|nr:class I SAM-dependent methyltransferase [Pseudovibrio sp. M1P-2-3]
MDIDWGPYLSSTTSLPHRPETELAVKANQSPTRTAIDCGCGAGRDIAYLREQGYQTFGFDSDVATVDVCKHRFADDNSVTISHASFETYEPPQASLILAHSSLFFCPRYTFEIFWDKILKSLEPKGVISCNFLGQKDSWLGKQFHRGFAVNLQEINKLFSQFDIVKLSERNEDGATITGDRKHWHTYTVIARRK